MKKRLLIITLILVALLGICHLNSSAAIYGNYGYTVNDGKAIITFIVKAPASEITIPSNIGGYPVVAIGDEVFQGQIGLTSVTVPEGIETIGSNTFKSCYALKNVNLPRSLKTIGASAFSNCTAIEEICIPYSVNSIGTYAFENCTSLKGISIPSSLSSVSNGVFYGCESLEYINIPSTVKSIGWGAFYYQYYSQRALDINYYGTEAEFYGINISNGNECLSVLGWIDYGVDIMHEENYTYTIENDEITLDIIYNSNLNVTIPHTLGGCPVVCIGELSVGNIFRDNDSVRNVELPSTIKRIGDLAFNGCNFLQNINIPNNVTEIGICAFQGCYGLTSITLPKSINLIEESAFEDCKNLQEITIPEQVTEIERSTFANCYSLKTITLPEKIERIGYYAFSDCTLISSVNFNGTKEQWGNVVIDNGNDYLVNTTVNCLKIRVTGITLNKNKLSLYVDDTTTLTATITPTNATNKNVTWTTSNSKVATISNGVIIAKSSGTATITANTLDGNFTATCVVTVNAKTIPVTGVSISKNSITLLVGQDEYLTETVSPTNATNRDVIWTSLDESVATVDKWGSVSAVGYGCTTIKVTTVDGSYTDTCDVIVSLSGECGENLVWKLNTAGVLTINGTGDMYDYLHEEAPWYTYYTYIKEVIVESGVTSIGEQAFYDCNDKGSAITQVSIPDTIITIGDSAFNKCKALREIVIPDTVIKIGDYAFAKCIALDEIVIPDSVTELGFSVFEDCIELKNITIGSGVTYIHNNIFTRTYKLENINVSDDNEHYCDFNGNLYGSNMYYFVAYASGKSATSFSVPEGVLVIGQGAFRDCDSLTDVIIPDSVIKMEMNAFGGCQSLKSITIGCGVEKVEEWVIAECGELTDVYYNGTAEQWSQIDINEDNRELFNAKIHYIENTTPMITLSMDKISVSGISESCILIVASYNNSKSIDIKTIPISSDITMTLSETEINTINANTIKGFLWQSVQNLKPLCEAQSISIE